MYQTDFSGPPTPPFRHRRGNRSKSGCLGKFAAIPTDAKIKIGLLVIGMLASFGCGLWWIFKPSGSQADETPPTPTIEIITAAAPTEPPAPPPVPLTTIPISVLETPDVARTATFQAAISRPAISNPDHYPYFVGVITYEDGCLVSNLGFTTAGYRGKPYYLYFNQPLERDPAMQVVQIQGYIQEFESCQYPVIFVQQLFWLDYYGTPALLSVGGPVMTGTATMTATVSAWGQASGPRPTNTPTYTVWIPPQRDLPPLATYTPYPTYTPQPVDVIVQTVIPHIPTYTPYPTYTPDPATQTPTATATPHTISLYGPVQAVAGCPQSNFAVNASGTTYYIILAGAALPPGQPTNYLALVSGQADQVCNGQAVRASQIIWYEITPTPTFTPTFTPTLTPTFTPTLTPTATLTPTVVITP